jgi:epoxyqueuosine reductase
MTDLIWPGRVTARLAQAGLNLSGVADAADHDHVLPGCRAALIFASGGAALWQAFLDDLRRAPGHLTDEAHPLDAFVRRQVAAADPSPPPSRRWVFAAAEETTFVDFRPLAQSAGLGWQSLTGLLIHPEWGLWLGLRAACFTTEPLVSAGALAGPSPCEGCPAPCASACHGGALTPDAGMDIRRCAAFHVQTGERGPCFDRCDARQACPVGADRAYPEPARRYHYDRRTGRRDLAAALGIEGDRLEGVGPHWGDWG